MDSARRYTIGEVAEISGISRRAVRYYVQRGLIPPPPGAGRGHYYTAEHLQRIRELKELQANGLSLEEIERRLAQPESREEAGPPGRDRLSRDLPTVWARVAVADGVELQVEAGRYRLSPGKVRRVAEAVRRILGEGFSGGEAAERDDANGEKK